MCAFTWVKYVNNRTPADRKKGVVYKIACGDCEAVYIGETGRTLQKRVTEYKYAVWTHDVAVHAWSRDHRVDWDLARVVALAPYTWERDVTEALHIHQQASTMNLDCGLTSTPYGTPSSIIPPYLYQRLPIPNLTGLSMAHICFSSITFLCFKFQNFNSNYQHMHVHYVTIHHYLYIILCHYGSCNSTDEVWNTKCDKNKLFV